MDPGTAKQVEAARLKTVSVQVRSTEGLAQTITDGRHTWSGDEALDTGGLDGGPSPYELLLSALGTCSSMTVTLYARHKGWPLEHVVVRLTHRKIEEGAARTDKIERELELLGPLDAEQRQRLLEIANRCPVYRTLQGKVEIQSRLRQTAAT